MACPACVPFFSLFMHLSGLDSLTRLSYIFIYATVLSVLQVWVASEFSKGQYDF